MLYLENEQIFFIHFRFLHIYDRNKENFVL